MSEPTAAQPPAPGAQSAEPAKSSESTAPTSPVDPGASVSDEKPAAESATEVAPEAAPAAAAQVDESAAAAPAENPDNAHDVVMKDASDDAPAPPADASEDGDARAPGDADTKAVDADKAEERPADVAAPATPADKSKSRRKSTSASASKAKKLNKKASRARLTHLDAKPGDYYFVRLKGYPRWPVIICDDDMLPESLLKTRPVTARRPDGTYREDFADGGKKAHDRTFAVMYLYTNEFGWVPNTDLEDLDVSTVADLASDKMRKDLQAAHRLAGEGHDLQHFKDLLKKHQEDLLQEEAAKEAAVAAKDAKSQAAAAKKSKKASKEDLDEDVDMAEPADEVDDEPVAKEKKPSKKRKAEDDAATPQRSDSVKKPKIKLTTSSTPKAPANGVAAPKPAAKAAPEAKPAKSKSKKGGKEGEEKKTDKEKDAPAPKEPEMSAEDKHARKEKEVLFLRHKLQKGLLTRDQEPKEEEMKTMSDYIAKLEGMPELEVSIIRATKINKVLKGILKLESIPKEDEFKFKSRSQTLLDKWNKLLSVEGAPSATPAAGAGSANGVNGDPPAKKGSAGGSKEKSTEATNGVKENGDASSKAEGEASKDKQASVEKTAKTTEEAEAVA